MRQSLLIVIAISLFMGCSKKDELILIEPPVATAKGLTKEEIYKQTGCYPKGIETIDDLGLYVDESNNDRYLYGSKIRNEKSNFWVSKFNSSGNYVWEFIKENGTNSHAYNPVILSNGNIVIANVIEKEEFLIKAVIPLIISPSDSILKTVNVPEDYFYSDVHVFEDFFFCTISQEEVDLNPLAYNDKAQISNDGNLLKEDSRLIIPEGDVIWKDTDWFLSIDTISIKKRNILPFQAEGKWTYNITLPASYKECDINASFGPNSVIVDYSLSFENENKNLYYYLTYDTGELIKVEGDGHFAVESLSIDGIYLLSGSQYPSSNQLQLSHGDQLKINVAITPSYATNPKLNWSSSDTELAVVDDAGVFTITSNTELKGNVEITATTDDGGLEATLSIDVDDVFLKAQGVSWIQSGTSNTVTLISKIKTSINKSITLDKILLVDENGYEIQTITNITHLGNSVICRSNSVVANGISSQLLQDILSKWKFVYTYKVTGQTDYRTKEVNVNANLWSSNI